MRLVKFISHNFHIVSLGIEDEKGALSPKILAELEGLGAKYQASAQGAFTLLERYSKQGRHGLTSGQLHEANKEKKIWEIKKGDIRIYFFEDRGKLLVASHAILKKTQKAQKKDINRAVALREKYLSAQENGTLEVIDCLL